MTVYTRLFLKFVFTLLILLAFISLFGVFYKPLQILKVSYGIIALFMIALTLLNIFRPEKKVSSYDFMSRKFFLMPSHSPFLQVIFHSFGEMLYRLIYFQNYDAVTETEVMYSTPFKGRWAIVNGGNTPEHSHSWDIINQRYAYDFIIAQDLPQEDLCADDKVHEASTILQPSDFQTYGQEILSPADGLVILTQNHIPDSQIIGEIDNQSPDFRGNFVVIKHTATEYSFLCHLIPNSVVVSAGQFVHRGEPIGLCGHSGHSTQPHLHFHVQDTPIFHFGKGLKINFDDTAQQLIRYSQNSDLPRSYKPESERLSLGGWFWVGIACLLL